VPHKLEVTGSNPVPATSTRRLRNRGTGGLTTKAEASRPAFSGWKVSLRNDLRLVACLGSLALSPSTGIVSRPKSCPKRPSGDLCLGVSLPPAISGYQRVASVRGLLVGTMRQIQWHTVAELPVW